MKCRSCGANLEIDTAFCPYCGKANPVAKKHREDMARFEKDYRTTKKEVLTNTGRFNRRTLRITAVAVTVAALAIMILSLVFNDNLAYSHYRERAAKESINYLEDIKTLVEERDYLALDRLVNAKDIRAGYKDDGLGRFRYVINANRNYADLFEALMRADYGGSYGSSMASTLSSAAFHVFKNVKEGREQGYDEFEGFYADIVRDTLLLLETCLNMDKEQMAEFPEVSEARLTLAIEEALDAYRK